MSDNEKGVKLNKELGLGEMIPRWYQSDAHELTADHIRKSSDPAFLDVTVGGGKSFLIAMICAQAQLRGMRVLVLARQGELVEQNAAEMWNCGVKNSIYSASLGMKSKKFPVIVGTEGTVAKAIDGDLADFNPSILLIDEAHMVNFMDIESQYMKIITILQRRNPKLRIIGYTGSPFRGVEPIIGQFWKKSLSSVTTEQLVEESFLVPTYFGETSSCYNLEKFKSSGEDGISDYTAKELSEMQKVILDDMTTTQKIMMEVQGVAKDRNGVLITCAGRKHCEEASKFLPKGSFGIVTDKTKKKDRRDILKKAYNGEIKYVFQVGCLTTGVNIPLWDTSVILRKIGSLTLLVQLLGRGMRTLKKDQLEAGIVKTDHLVLDYSDTMRELGGLYSNPILEASELQRATREGDLIECPACSEINSSKARRCCGKDSSSTDGRCEHFWQSVDCDGCGIKNDITARYCRSCEHQIKDPNENLTGKRYTDADWRQVEKFNLRLTKCGNGLLIEWEVFGGEKARRVYFPKDAKTWQRVAFFNEFVVPYIGCKQMAKRYFNVRNASDFVKMKSMFSKPTHITIRKGKHGDIVRSRFSSGRVEG